MKIRSLKSQNTCFSPFSPSDFLGILKPGNNLKKIIAQGFNYDVMARRSLGLYWEKLNEEEQAEFNALLRALFQECHLTSAMNYFEMQLLFS